MTLKEFLELIEDANNPMLEIHLSKGIAVSECDFNTLKDYLGDDNEYLNRQIIRLFLAGNCTLVAIEGERIKTNSRKTHCCLSRSINTY